MISNASSDPTEVPIAPIRLLGGVGIAAGLVNAVADYALRGGPRPVSGAAISLEALGSVPHESVWFGSLLGAAAMPLWILALLLPFLMGCGSEAADGGSTLEATSERGLYRVRVRLEAPPIPIGRLHRWVVEVEDRAGQPVDPAELIVDGGMPQHGHGLPSAPKAGRHPDGRIVIEGMHFNMAGEWILEIGVVAAGGDDVARFQVQVDP